MNEHVMLMAQPVAQRQARFWVSLTDAEVDPDDLVTDTTLYVAQRFEDYDPDRGKLSTFIGSLVSSKIRHLIRDSRPNPCYLQEFYNRVERLEAQYGRPVTDDEICRDLDITEEQLSRYRLNSRANYPFAMEPNSPGIPIDFFATGVDDLYRDIEQSEMHRVLQNAVEELPDREREVVTRYYLLGETIGTIGHALRISSRTVVDSRNAGIARLREALAEHTDLFTSGSHSRCEHHGYIHAEQAK